MKKVTAFVGSAHKKNTRKAVAQFFDNLHALGEVETELVTLTDYKLGFYSILTRPADAAPSLMQVLIFRMGRTTIRQEADQSSIDYQYYNDRGWLESDYYYTTRLNPVKKAAGSLIDSLAAAVRGMM